MRFTCKQASLKLALAIVSRAVPTRNTMPILHTILLETEQGRVKVSGTDLELGITCWLDETSVQEPGRTAISAKTFSEVIANCPPTTLELSLLPEAGFLNIRGVRGSGMRNSPNVRVADPAEFPPFPIVQEDTSPIIFECSALKEMIRQVIFSASDDDSRPVLTSVLIEIDEQFAMAAADSFRLAFRSTPLPERVQRMEPLLVPAKTLWDLFRILPDEGIVQLRVSSNRSQVLFHTDRLDLTSRLIEGHYPNIRNAIPREFTTRAVFDTREFADAVKAVLPFARNNSNITRISVGEASMTIEARADDLGNDSYTLDATVDGPALEINFNCKYLDEGLTALDTPQLALELTTSARPGVMKPVSPIDYSYILMPMSSNR